MRLLFVLFLLLGWSPSTTLAQSIENTQSVPPSISTTLEQVQGAANPLFVVDVVTQREASLLGTDPFLTQFDGSISGNAAQISQLGDGNVTILQQYGDQNVASIRLSGDGNTVDATQAGSGNLLGISVLGSDNVIPVSQFGVANELSIELLNVNDLDFGNLPNGGIQQIGGGVPLHIQIVPGQ
jgi:hypothetical protein